MKIGSLIIRIIVSAIAVGIATFFTPGMSNEGGFTTLILAAIVIGILDWAVAKVAKVDASPFGRGIIGFAVAAIILYVTGLIVDGFNVGVLGAIIGALILGVVDALMPGHETM